MRTAVGPVTLRRSGELVESETTVTPVGPNVVVLSTAVPDLGLTVTTTYSGAADAATIAVDLIQGQRGSVRHEPREIPRETVPVTHAREHCLLDHAQQVMNATNRHDGGRHTVHVSDDALERASALF